VDVSLPLFDTTLLHAVAAADVALGAHQPAYRRQTRLKGLRDQSLLAG
jgi:hypothetical protein